MRDNINDTTRTNADLSKSKAIFWNFQDTSNICKVFSMEVWLSQMTSLLKVAQKNTNLRTFSIFQECNWTKNAAVSHEKQFKIFLKSFHNKPSQKIHSNCIISPRTSCSKHCGAEGRVVSSALLSPSQWHKVQSSLSCIGRV